MNEVEPRLLKVRSLTAQRLLGQNASNCLPKSSSAALAPGSQQTEMRKHLRKVKHLQKSVLLPRRDWKNTCMIDGIQESLATSLDIDDHVGLEIVQRALVQKFYRAQYPM